MELYNAELDVWNIIAQILHQKRDISKETTEHSDVEMDQDPTIADGIEAPLGDNVQCIPGLLTYLLSLLVPESSMTLLHAVTILARKCLSQGKYHDSADRFLDVLSSYM